MTEQQRKLRVMLVSIAPPRNDCGVRIVLHRHLVERAPFELHVASNADFADDLLIHTKLELPWLVQKLRKSRFGPWLRRWIQDYENLAWPLAKCRELERAIDAFKPDVILTLAETGLCHIAAKAARRRGIPLAGLFLDWFPIMDWHYGHRWTQGLLSKRFRRLYAQCDLAFCTSDGMQEVLGPHPNSHVIYPMPGRAFRPEKSHPASRGKFRLVYVGNAERFYGRMLRSLWREVEKNAALELLIVGPHKDWTSEEIKEAGEKGVCLGFLAPEKAAEVIAGADALLVVMSFEKENELFMRTSFTTKFLDYAPFGKPVILWGPEYCTPSKLARREKAALVVGADSPASLIEALQSARAEGHCLEEAARGSLRLSKTIFDPERLQDFFTREIKTLAAKIPPRWAAQPQQ